MRLLCRGLSRKASARSVYSDGETIFQNRIGFRPLRLAGRLLMESNRFHISPGPHLHLGLTTRQIMWWVNFSLAPLFIWAVFLFGFRVIVLSVSGVAGALGGEALCNILMKRRETVTDGSAFLTGLLLVGTLSPGLPLWMPAVGGFVAIVFAKMLFGGLGANIFNPALIGRAFLMASFPLAMTTSWLKPFETITQATPLNVMKLEGLSLTAKNVLEFFVGVRGGSIGEVSVVLILVGAGVLLWKKIIRLTVPLSVLAGTLLISLFSGSPLFHLLTGGLWFGAFYMATDIVTAPIDTRAQIIFGLGIGLITGVIRLWGGYPEGICYAILIMNALTPAFNRWFRPKRSYETGVIP